jgi:L-Ala-D/L-Glu epimerase
MKLQHDISVVHTTNPFVIARGANSDHRLIRVRVIDGDMEGWGEASPNRFYGETTETALAALERLTPIVEAANPWHLEDIEDEMNRALRLNGSIKSAISAALHDLAGKRLGVPVYKMWGLDAAKAPLSSFTIAIAANDDELRQRIAEAEQYPVLKIKLGTDRDEHIIRTVRDAAGDKILRVDANAAWTAKKALRMIDVLVECGVEYVEQPLPAHDLEGTKFVRDRSKLPVICDESCVTSADIPKLVGVADACARRSR